MTEVVTIALMRTDAHELMERALVSLDCAGEQIAAIHLDFAIEALGLRSKEVSAAMIAAITPMDDGLYL